MWWGRRDYFKPPNRTTRYQPSLDGGRTTAGMRPANVVWALQNVWWGRFHNPPGGEVVTVGPLAFGEAAAHPGLAGLIAGHFPNNQQMRAVIN
jgi:hypothetical protein